MDVQASVAIDNTVVTKSMRSYMHKSNNKRSNSNSEFQSSSKENAPTQLSGDKDEVHQEPPE